MITYSELCRLGIGSELVDRKGLAWAIRTVTDDGRSPRRRCVLLHRGSDDRVLRLHEGKVNHEWTMVDAETLGILKRMTSPVPLPEVPAGAVPAWPPEGAAVACALPARCACNSFTLTWYGHDASCPERKR